jgi:hypothetical protein
LSADLESRVPHCQFAFAGVRNRQALNLVNDALTFRSRWFCGHVTPHMGGKG